MKLRFSAYYAASVGSLAFLPFLSPILASRMGNDSLVALTLALLPLGRLLGGTGWSWVADRLGNQKILRLTTTSAAILSAVVLLAPSGAWLAVSLGLFAIMRSPQYAIVDAETLRRMGDAYGAIRMWGSIAFLGTILLAGQLRDVHPSSPIALAVVLLALTAIMAWSLPVPAEAARPLVWADALDLLQRPVLRSLFLVAMLQGMTLTTYDTLFALHVERLGHSSTTASLGLALGVTGEIFIMLFAAPLLARLGPSRLILIAALTGPPRWALTAMSADPAVLVATQSLHALGFGAFWIGGTRLVSRQAPTALASTAQSLLTASGWGIGNLASMALAAVLLPTGGTPLVFLGSAVLSGAAVVAAAHLQTQQDPPPGRV